MVIDDNNFLLIAMNNYQNPSCCTLEEFEEDLRKITYIKKQLAKKDKNTRLILNHIIVLFNVFGNAALYMLFHKVDKEQWGSLSTFLLYISRMPDEIPEFNVKLSSLTLDESVIRELRKL